MVLYALVMDMEQMNHALLKVKCRHSMNPESIPFEEYISSSNTSIKIEFPDGKNLMEKGFRSISVPMDKFYMEFYEDIPTDHMMDYLLNEDSDYRVTSLDGTIIRLSHKDYEAIPKEIKDDKSTKPLKEYVFVKQKKSFFERIRGVIHKKDN